MIILDALTKAVEIDLSGAVATNQLSWTIHYIQSLDSDQSVSDIASADGATNNTTNVLMVTGPATGSTRTVKSLTVHNADTTGAIVSIVFNNNGTLRNLWKGLLLTGENLEYSD